MGQLSRLQLSPFSTSATKAVTPFQCQPAKLFGLLQHLLLGHLAALALHLKLSQASFHLCFAHFGVLQGRLRLLDFTLLAIIPHIITDLTHRVQTETQSCKRERRSSLDYVNG